MHSMRNKMKLYLLRQLRAAVAVIGLVIASTIVIGGSTSVAAKLSRPSFTPTATVFNNPQKSASKAEQYKIINYINKAINSTTKGATIRISMYSMDIKSSADAIINAHKRGVNVRFVTDDHAASSVQMKRVKEALAKQAIKGQSSLFKACDYGCTSDYTYNDGENEKRRAFNHAKFITFSSTSKTSDADTKLVTMITSSNLTATQAENGWNNLTTIVGDKTSYNFLAEKFDVMAKDKNQKNPYDEATSGKYKLYFFPRLEQKQNDEDSDTIMGILNNIRCSGVAKGYGYSDGKTRRTTIRIAMYQWTQTRDYLAEKLWQLNNDGCDVQVVISKGETDDEIVRKLTRPTKSKRGAIEVRNADKSGEFVHHKYLLINGKYLDDTSAKIVFTGSPNLTRVALRYNNELMVRITSDSIFDSYAGNFNKIFKVSKTLKYVDPN